MTKIKCLFTILLISAGFSAHGQIDNTYTIHDLKRGEYKSDSSYIYQLPFKKGKKYLLIQGYDSKMSHKNELALDFKMKKGSLICAARGGVVAAMREDSDVGGLKDEYLSEGNYIIINHTDGTTAYYWHLQKDGVLVNTGDTIKQGQEIGLSGNTGYTAFPHLHFEVVPGTSNKTYQNFNQLPTRFYTKKGALYLKPGKYYKCVRH